MQIVEEGQGSDYEQAYQQQHEMVPGGEADYKQHQFVNTGHSFGDGNYFQQKNSQRMNGGGGDYEMQQQNQGYVETFNENQDTSMNEEMAAYYE